MDERTALALLGDRLSAAGDDAAVVGDLVLTTDMLHETTDFPAGTTRYTAGWRAMGASLSDLAAMGATATAGLAVYAAPTFERTELTDFVDGAVDVCEAVGGAYVGGDLDEHEEFTVATTAVGRADDPVFRGGAAPGDVVCVTGRLGRTAGALECFRAGDHERANERFRFTPRVAAGRTLAAHATAMMDVSDGLARSLHQLAAASDCGFTVDGDAVPVDPVLAEHAGDADARLEGALYVGEDFELCATVPEDAVEPARDAIDAPLAVVGSVTDGGLTLDGEDLPDRGYTHGG